MNLVQLQLLHFASLALLTTSLLLLPRILMARASAVAPCACSVPVGLSQIFGKIQVPKASAVKS